MSSGNGLIESPAPSDHASSCDRASLRRRLRTRPSLLNLLWWSVPLHVLLAFGFWWMMQHQPARLGTLVIGVHLGFPLLLVVTVRWWWDRWGELLGVLLINHLATFLVLLCLPWW